MVIYRPGAVTAVQIRDIAGAVEIFKAGKELRETPREALPSPGVGLRHYAPKARLVLVDAPLEELGARMAEEALRWPGARLGLMLPEEVAAPVEGVFRFAGAGRRGLHRDSVPAAACRGHWRGDAGSAEEGRTAELAGQRVSKKLRMLAIYRMIADKKKGNTS
jgi:hypothetical protein